ncbi:hypothetical protein JG688_00017218 [Phytophthora aleatoria]|uniref:Uncharacterized protein n=1 Tax=Phytophthora aleatoria TaxID=2496075 RepID=A0A8J5IXD7_9STRA|nr:hypothetical protein JG688_00017218 [Phytophthora aleatoria]
MYTLRFLVFWGVHPGLSVVIGSRLVLTGTVGVWNNACVREVDKTAHHFAVCITKMKTEHSHWVDSNTYQQYPANRISVGETVLQTYITGNSNCHPTIRDVHNLVRALKIKSTESTPSAQRLKAWMIDFSGEAGNVGRIFVEAQHNKVSSS